MTKTSVAPTIRDEYGQFSRESVDRLFEAARAAAERAYAPYSNYRVGAVVVTAEGDIVTGCNVENTSYGLTCCAERTAIFSAIAQGHTDLIALAVSCPEGDARQPWTLMPCGACRQVMVELLNPDAVIFVDQRGMFDLDALLPHPFML